MGCSDTTSVSAFHSPLKLLFSLKVHVAALGVTVVPVSMEPLEPDSGGAAPAEIGTIVNMPTTIRIASRILIGRLIVFIIEFLLLIIG